MFHMPLYPPHYLMAFSFLVSLPRQSQLLLHLSFELANETKQEGGRQLAGLYLKNTITAKDPQVRDHKRQRWLTTVDANTKGQIKSMILQALQSGNPRAGATAAQVVGTIGAVELPLGQWDGLLDALLHNVVHTGNDVVRVSTLQALGYICEDLQIQMGPGQEVPQKETDMILTAIVDGIRSDRPADVRLAAATALCNSLDFCRRNMEKEGERNMIMQVICEATQCEDARVKKKAFECIAVVASLYYDKLQPYITTLFELTLTCIKEGSSEAAFQAIEFWNTLCDEEVDIIREIQEYQEYGALETRAPGEQGPRQCFYYVQNALAHLVPLLTELLTKQEEHHDDDSWNMAMAGGTCLSLVALTVEDKILPYVVQFVVSNISDANWRLREAATMAFGSILDGPSSGALQQMVSGALPYLVQGLQDAHPMVKDTSAWTLGKVFELHWRCVPLEHLGEVVKALLHALGDPAASVSSKACFAVYNLASDRVAEDYPAASPTTNYLSPFFPHLVEKLLGVAERPDGSESNLRAAAYEAVNMLVTSAAPDCNELIGQQVVPLLLMRLQQTFQMSDLTLEAKEELWGLQSLLCGTLMTCTQKLDQNIAPYADKMMELLIEVFRRHRHASAHEEAFMAVGALADKLEGGFLKYMPHFQEYLYAGLRNYEDSAVCIVAVGVVGDLSRALERKLAPFCDPIVEIFLMNLRNVDVSREVKPHILACFGDIALQIGGEFERFLHVTMTILGQAAMTTSNYNAEEEDMVEHINHLRESILDAYTGIVQGLSADNKQGLLVQPAYLQPLVALLMAISEDPHSDEGVIKRTIGLVGDLGSKLGDKVASAIGFNNLWVQHLYKDMDEYGEETKKIAAYTRQVLERLVVR